MSHAFCFLYRVTNKSLFVSLDETTDSCGRAMTAVLVGPLDGRFQGRPFLIDLVDIGSANNRTVQQAIMSALHRLLGEDLQCNNVQLFLTDAAPYCVKAGTGLKIIFSQLIHVTCLHRVAQFVRYNNRTVDKVISKTKKIFIKCVRRCKDLCKIPLLPVPVLTR